MQFRFARRTVGRKLAFTVVFAVLLAVLIASFASAWRDAVRQFELTKGQLTGIAEVMAATLSEPLAAGRQRSVANALRGAGKLKDITFIRVFDMDDRRIASFGSGVLLRRTTPHAELVRLDDPFTVFSLSSYPVVVPIVQAGRTVGKLEMIADLSRLKTGFVDAILQSLSIGFLASMFALFVSARLQRTVTDPITSLTRAMQRISQAESYYERVEPKSIDETAVLVSTFNSMLDEIQQRNQALRRHRDKLEDDVRARTRDLQEAKLEADQANAAKSDFLATMSHEIRTPMNGMMVMAELLAATELTPRNRRYSDVLLASGQSLLAIIDDILDISKIEAGRLDLEEIPTDPTACVDDVTALFAERAASRNLELACVTDPAIPPNVYADPVRLNQILSNLVSNALKFTEAGGVTIRTAVTGQTGSHATLRFEVADTGIGIPESKCDAVFEAFTQAEQSTTRRFGGTGIGLAICKRLVTAMDGKIGVESTLGTGTTFWFEIPFRLTEPTTVPTPAMTPAPECELAGTVLIEMAEGPTRSALVDLVTSLGAVPITQTTAEDQPSVVIARYDDFRNPGHIAMPAGATRLAVVAFGQGSGSSLIDGGTADAILESPVGTRQTRALITAALAGRDSLRDLLSTQAQTSQLGDRVSFSGVHVLAADDSAVNREVLTEVLSRLGVRLTCVENGAEAVAALADADHGYDLVFMDGSMPEMDGTTATHCIRQHEQTNARPAVPIIALTAHVVGRAADEWYEAGATDYISKPFKLATIQACLERHLPDRVGHAAASPPAERTPPSEQNTDDANVGTAELVDLETIAAIEEMQPGGALLQRVIALYAENAPAALQTVLASGGDARALASAAHALKSLCRSIGATRLGNLCDHIELGARSGQTLSSGDGAELECVLSETLAALATVTSPKVAA